MHLYINRYATGHDPYSIGWWFHWIMRHVGWGRKYGVGGFYPLYYIWFRLNCSCCGWGYRVERMPRYLKRPIEYLQARAPKKRRSIYEARY